MKQYDIYGIGAALVDTEIQINDQELADMGIEKGLMTLVDEQRQEELLESLSGHLVHSTLASGGSACNSIIAANYLGSNNFFSCKVANDLNGQFFISDLNKAGVKTADDKAFGEGITGKCLVLITPDAERSMNTFLGVSETFSVEQLDEEALKQSNYFYCEGYLVTSPTGRAAAIKAKNIAEQNQVKTALSLSDPGIVEFFKEGLQEIVGEGVDLIFCNKDEALAWTDTDSLEAAAETLKNSAKSFAITLGSEGSYIFDGKDSFTVAGQKTQAVDTNGAGDMFAGAFLYAINNGKSYKEAAELANKAAAKVVSQYGPRLKPEDYQQLK